MIKQMTLAPMLLGAALLSGQAPSTSTRSASLDDVVSEVRALRAEMKQTAEAGLRAQLLVARLQVEEQRIAGLARQLSETEQQMRSLEDARNPMLEQMIKEFDKNPPEPGEVDMFAGLRAHLEKIQSGDPVLKERQASLSRQLADEQARWVAFNAQLEALEKSVTAVTRDKGQGIRDKE
jgi:chromosome segregation ATPase